MKLYGYYRSSSAYRVRIGLALKELPFDYLPIHLVRGGGEQFSPAFQGLNPQALVPVLVDGEATMTQSLAILEYLEETHPRPALLPSGAAARARVRSIALAIACEIHPLNNLRVLNRLTKEMGLDEAAKLAWYRHWVKVGFDALETQLARDPATGRFCHGDSPTMADCCLVPQLFNARRFQCPLDGYPTLLRIEAACLALEPFKRAAPEVQPDAEPAK